MSAIKPDQHPFDSALPYLQHCADPRTIQHLVNTHWGWAIQTQDQIALARMRYRRGQRCILQFSVNTANRASEWVSALVYPLTHIEEVWQKIQRRLGWHPAFAAHTVCIKEWGVVLLRYPFDHQLTQLPHHANGISPETQAALATALGLDANTIVESNVELLRYRFGICAVLRITLRDALNTSRQAILKCFPDAQAQASAETLRLWQRHTGLSTVAPLLCLDEDRSLFLSHAQGPTLESLLVAGELGQAFHRLGHDLAALHRNANQLTLPKQHTQDMEATNLRRATTYLAEALPERADELAKLTERIIAEQQWAAQGVPTHRDLKLDHVFVEGDRLALIDFDSCAMSDPLLDPALLLARLAAAPYLLAVSEDACVEAAQQFLKAYSAAAWDGSEAAKQRMAPFVAGAMLDVAAGFYRRREANWFEAVNALIARAYGPVSNAIST